MNFIMSINERPSRGGDPVLIESLRLIPSARVSYFSRPRAKSQATRGGEHVRT